MFSSRLLFSPPSFRPAVRPAVDTVRLSLSLLLAYTVLLLFFAPPFFFHCFAPSFFSSFACRRFDSFLSPVGWAAPLQGVRAAVLLRVQPLPSAAPEIVRHPRPAEAVPAVQRPGGTAPGDASG